LPITPGFEIVTVNRTAITTTTTITITDGYKIVTVNRTATTTTHLLRIVTVTSSPLRPTTITISITTVCVKVVAINSTGAILLEAVAVCCALLTVCCALVGDVRRLSRGGGRRGHLITVMVLESNGYGVRE
jgi:hypothetical protein